MASHRRGVHLTSRIPPIKITVVGLPLRGSGRHDEGKSQRDKLMPMFHDRISLANDYVQGSPTVEGALESGWYAGGKVSEEPTRSL
jgi:hypothetical protein